MSVFAGEPKEMQVGIRHLDQGGIYFRWREQPFILLNCFYILEDRSMYDATEYDNHKPHPQETLPIRGSVDNLTKSCVVERLADAARIDCAHGVVWAALLVTFDSVLHVRRRQNTISTRGEFGTISVTEARAKSLPSEWSAKPAPGLLVT